MPERPNVLDSFALQIIILDYGGVNKRKKGESKTPHYLKIFISWFFTIGLSLSLFTQMIIDMKDIKKFFNSLYIFITMFSLIAKVLNFLPQRGVYSEIHAMIQNPLMNSYDEMYDPLVNELVVNFRRFSNMFVGSCVSMSFFVALKPLVDADPKNPTFTPGYFIVDSWEYQYYVLTFQLIAALIAVGIQTSLDLLFNALVAIASLHFEILKDEFSRIGVGEEEEVLNRLRFCIRRHNFLVEFTKKVGSLMSFGVLGQIVSSIIVFCSIGIQFLIMDKLQDAMGVLNYLFTMLFEVGLYCWFGNELLLKSVKIADGCYASDWYERSTRVQKMLCFVMERAKRPVFLSAGKLIAVTVPTFVFIISKAYSYYTVIQTVVKGKS